MVRWYDFGISLSQGDVIFAQLACPWMIYNSSFTLGVTNVVSKVRKKIKKTPACSQSGKMLTTKSRDDEMTDWY